MGQIDTVGTYLGTIVESGVGVTKNGFPQWVVRFQATKKYIVEASDLAFFKLTEPAYVLDVAIRRQSVTLAGDRQAALRPDMLLTATIETDQRTILAWIGESVFGVAQR